MQEKMKDKVIAVLILLAAVFFGMAIAVGSMSCNSFKKIDSGISMECDVYYTTLRTLGGKEGESTFVGTVYVPCNESIARIRQAEKEAKCAKEFFPEDGVVDKTNYKVYTQYLECCQGK